MSFVKSAPFKPYSVFWLKQLNSSIACGDKISPSCFLETPHSSLNKIVSHRASKSADKELSAYFLNNVPKNDFVDISPPAAFKKIIPAPSNTLPFSSCGKKSK